jgi:hypothetical protein
MGTTLSSDNKLAYIDNGPVNGTALKRDSLIKYLETGSDTHWDPGEPVVYDLNNDSFYQSVEPTIAGSLPIGSRLNTDPLIKYVDTSNSSRWQPGDAVVYDSNNSYQYVVGKPVIAGAPVIVGSALASDGHVKFIGSGATWAQGNTVVYASNGGNYYNASSDPHLKYVRTGTNITWVTGEPVVYDVNLTGTFVNGDPVLYGAKPSIGSSLRVDPKILFVDSNRNSVWDSGEAIVYDSNGNGVFASSDPVILAASPPIGVGLSSDPKLRYVKSGSNSTWVPGETLVYDSIGMGYYNATIDPKITFWDMNGTGTFHTGDPVIYDLFGLGYYKSGDPVIQNYGHSLSGQCSLPGDCPLTIDQHFHFVDTTFTGHWVSGDTVIYDPDSDHVYMAGDLVIAGTAPANGTPLVEPVLQGKAPPVGTLLKSDYKVKYLQLSGVSAWQQGEAVVYDSNNDTIYDLTPSPPDIVVIGTSPVVGTLLSEPVIAGPIPKIGTALKTDNSIKFIDAARTGVWNPVDALIYHSGAGGYTQGDPIITGGVPERGVWQSGEVVSYDSNLDARFETGEPVVYGTSPLNGTSLSSDPKIKYIDAGSINKWVSGDTVVYDVSGNGVYGQGDILIVGIAPASAIYLGPSASMDNQGRVWLAWNEKPAGGNAHTTVYFKSGNGTTWSSKQAVSSGSYEDTGSFVTPLVNSTMMILWSSNRSSTASIFYRLYSSSGTAPFTGSGPVQLTSTTMYDYSPSAVQDRNGRIWVAWSRGNSAGTLSQIYYKYFNGTAWSADFALPPAIIPAPSESSPYITQVKDGRIAVVWADNATANLNLYFATVNDTSATLSTTVQPAWSSAVHLPFGNTSDEDDHPSLLQSQDGNFWIFFQRSILSPSAEDILGFTSSTLNSSSSWSQTSLPTSGNDQAPTAIENSDHNIWVFYNSVNLSSGLQILYEKSTSQVLGNDFGVQGLTAPSFIRAVYPINVTSLVRNSGSGLATATLTLFANSTILKSWTVSLTSGHIQSFYYNWTNAAYGRYTISSTLTNISPANSPNNLDTSVAYFMEVSPPGDVDGNGIVNIVDLAYIAFCWQQIAGSSPTCNQYVDTDIDGKPINIQDLALAAFYFGKSV